MNDGGRRPWTNTVKEGWGAHVIISLFPNMACSQTWALSSLVFSAPGAPCSANVTSSLELPQTSYKVLKLVYTMVYEARENPCQAMETSGLIHNQHIYCLAWYYILETRKHQENGVLSFSIFESWRTKSNWRCWHLIFLPQPLHTWLSSHSAPALFHSSLTPLYPIDKVWIISKSQSKKKRVSKKESGSWNSNCSTTYRIVNTISMGNYSRPQGFCRRTIWNSTSLHIHK